MKRKGIDKILADLLEAAKAACHHLDTYGIVQGDDREMERQRRVFDLLNPAIKAAEKPAKLSRPNSGCPPNKYRALAQQVSSLLMEEGYLSTKVDFVGEINDMEKLFADLEANGLINIHDQFYQD